MISVVHINQENCLNNSCENISTACKRCTSVCPANAIKLNEESTPQLDALACTACTACVNVCPANAIGHETSRPVALLSEARNMVMQGKTEINAACHAIPGAQNGLKISCHAMWDPMLLSCMAAEGVRTLNLEGLQQCATCPVRYGAEILQKVEKDYATLNTALAVQLAINKEKASVVEEKAQPEPERRAFFRNLIPSLAQGAAVTVAQVGHAASQAIEQEMHADEENTAPTALPIRLRLFLRALPRLQANFTPVPLMPSLPLGAIQADASCTACGECVEQCPTQALSLREFGNNNILEFQPEACIGCERCIAICPEKALASLPAISLPVLLTGRSRPLVMVSSKAS